MDLHLQEARLQPCVSLPECFPHYFESSQNLNNPKKSPDPRQCQKIRCGYDGHDPCPSSCLACTCLIPHRCLYICPLIHEANRAPSVTTLATMSSTGSLEGALEESVRRLNLDDEARNWFGFNVLSILGIPKGLNRSVLILNTGFRASDDRNCRAHQIRL